MGRTQTERLINGTLYAVTLMDAIKAVKIQTKLIKILGSSVLDLLFGGVDLKNLKDDPKTLQKITDMAVNMMSNFDDEVVSDLVISLFDVGVFVKVEEVTVPVEFRTHFIGKTAEMWQVAKFIMEVNFNGGKSIELTSPTTNQEKETPEN